MPTQLPIESNELTKADLAYTVHISRLPELKEEDSPSLMSLSFSRSETVFMYELQK